MSNQIENQLIFCLSVIHKFNNNFQYSIIINVECKGDIL